MARVCSGCGAELPEHARFCGACGRPVDQPAQPEKPSSAEAEPGEQAAIPTPDPEPWSPGCGDPEPVRQARKPLPKWVLPLGIGLCVAAVALAALTLALRKFNDPERTVDHFLEAMEDGDFAALSQVAAADGEALTEENTAPLFRLYAEDGRFRRNVESVLEEELELLEDGEEPDGDAIVYLRGESRFLYTAYTVVIAACDTVELASNLTCTAVLDGGCQIPLAPDTLSSDDGWAAAYGADYYLTIWSVGETQNVLPGRYTVRASVETSYGDTFTAETTLDVTDVHEAYGELTFDYTTMDIFNDSSMEAEIYINDQLYGTVPEHGDILIAPIRPETQLEARADVGTDEPMTAQFDASEGYYYLAFVLCDVEIYNAYQTPVTIWRDGEYLTEIGPGEEFTARDLPSGTVLTAHLYDDAICEPVEYVCEYEQDVFYPAFTASDETQQAVAEALTAYVDQLIELYNEADLDGLQAAVSSGFRMLLTEDLQSRLEAAGSAQLSRPEPLEITSIQVGQSQLAAAADVPVAYVYCDLPLHMDVTETDQDGSTRQRSDEGTQYLEFTVQLMDGAWSVAG